MQSQRAESKNVLSLFLQTPINIAYKNAMLCYCWRTELLECFLCDSSDTLDWKNASISHYIYLFFIIENFIWNIGVLWTSFSENFTFEVPENVSLTGEVGRLKVEDIDEPQNRDTKYSFRQGNYQDTFKIIPNRYTNEGVIQPTKVLFLKLNWFCVLGYLYVAS